MLSGSQHFEFEAREICLSSFPQNRKEKEPYIHPLSKPSISLHMCTESLFTESGSAIDPFSAPEPTRGPTKQRAERASGGAFPPPLASGMRVHSRREGGRLVISASASRGGGRLKAERGDGRLRLSLVIDGGRCEEEGGKVMSVRCNGDRTGPDRIHTFQFCVVGS